MGDVLEFGTALASAGGMVKREFDKPNRLIDTLPEEVCTNSSGTRAHYSNALGALVQVCPNLQALWNQRQHLPGRESRQGTLA